MLEWKASAEASAQSQLQTPGRPEGIDEPILILPATDAAVSWLPFSARATPLVGRGVELARLKEFLSSASRFSWWLITGAGGVGKSRLALELCYEVSPAWNAGFLSRADSFERWLHFRPSRPTLIVIDYVSTRTADVSALVLQLCQSTAYLPRPVRVLLLERDEGSWWPRFLREDSQSESAALSSCQHDDPLSLMGLRPEALNRLAADVARSRQVAWTDSMAREFESRMRTVDPHRRPLFGMMSAAYSRDEVADAIVDSTLLGVVLTKETGRRRAMIHDADRLRKLESLLALATLVGGLLPKSGGFTFLASSRVAAMLPDPESIDLRTYAELAGASHDDATLAGLQPDILGERFVLDRLGADVGDRTRRLLEVAWELQPADLCNFIVRVASDFPGDAGLDMLCNLPLDSTEARGRWGRLVGDLVRLANRSTDQRTQGLMARLRELAEQHAAEGVLQSAVARAELYLGNIFLFAEREYTQAAAQFETAISRAGAGSEIEAAAINNRGILYSAVQDEDSAFADWSEVIARTDVSDEARACSLNNRADVFARRGAHAEAIRDRSEVIALEETSPDRRYIALFRRSRSFLNLGRTDDALGDLDSILITDDIALPQKCEARVERAAILRELARWDDAETDLEAVVACEELFSGTSSEALVGLAELARLRRRVDRAREYLKAVLASHDATEHALVESLVVRARLLEDEGDAIKAREIWESVVANPNASARQRSIATNQVAAGG